MGLYIAAFGDRYCLWCTVEDAPATQLMTRAEMIMLLRQEWGERGLENIEQRLARVDRTGCEGPSRRKLLAKNRAGMGGTHVATEAGMVALYRR